jgi:hypothetical protein
MRRTKKALHHHATQWWHRLANGFDVAQTMRHGLYLISTFNFLRYNALFKN